MTNAPRAFCLYRVSLTRQADRHYSNGKETADIPMQKEACRQFCQDHGWEIVNSYTETGVSAYKKPRKCALLQENAEFFGKNTGKISDLEYF